MIRARWFAAFLVALTSAAASAQRDTASTRFVVKTIPLHHLSSAEASNLLKPYVRTNGGDVFAVSNVRAVTIRETQQVSNEMLAVLAKYDREPTTITLNFELVAGYTCDACAPPARPDRRAEAPADGLDSLMRKVLKYKRYRVLSATTATTDEDSRVSLVLSADGDPMRLEVGVKDVRVDDTQPLIIVDGVTQPTPPASVHLDITLWRDAIPARGQTQGRPPSQLFASGVTVPIGETVIMGSAVTTLPAGDQPVATRAERARGESPTDGALILVVRPQIAAIKR